MKTSTGQASSIIPTAVTKSERTGIAYGGTCAAAGRRVPIATTAASFTTNGQIAHSFNSAALTLG